MRERPILFSGAMVRAILADQKTQTRRIVKPQPSSRPSTRWPMLSHPLLVGEFAEYVFGPVLAQNVVPPYGVPGDRLWVRETWAPADCMYQDHDLEEAGVVAYRADLSARFQNPGRYAKPGPVRAYDLESWNFDALNWRPSIHMPRWASRLTLEVTSVRVERLHDISEEDARAEGMVRDDCTPGCGCGIPERELFARLWDEINGKRVPWASNPWAWVIDFRRVEDAA